MIDNETGVSTERECECVPCRQCDGEGCWLCNGTGRDSSACELDEHTKEESNGR